MAQDKGKGAGEGKGPGKGKQSDETGEYELEDEIVSAETEEWTPEDVEDDDLEDEAPEDAEDHDEHAEAPTEAEQTLVVAAEGEGGRLGSVRSALGAPFRWVGGLSFPMWAKFLTASLTIILSMAAATSAYGLMFLTDFARDIGGIPGLQEKLASVEGGAPQTILIIGSDLQPIGSSKKHQGLSDTTMLLRLDPDRDAIALFSLPRDLKVEIPGYGTDKLNVAYTVGGPEKTLATVQELTRSPERPDGLEVNHLVNVDFTGFARAVNEIDCVYVDVDRRYFHDNDNTIGAADYDELNIQPGYQALCGLRALDYVRYRHTDNDVVRAARQQDFLREARQKVPPEQLFLQRNKLIDIFVEHTTSDIHSVPQLLEMLKLFIEARDAPVKEIHFEGTLGPSFVTATDAQIDQAVNQFLGIQDTPGARGKSAAPTEPVADEPEGKASEGASATSKKKPAKEKPSLGSLSEADLAPSSSGKQLAQGMLSQRKIDLPIYYPTVLTVSSDYDQKPRVYKINGTGRGSPPDGERLSYKWVFSTPKLGEYYGFMGTKWRDPPILDNPSEEREIGDRTYKLYYAGDRLRIVAWKEDSGSFWVSNTLIQSLSEREMIEIARGMRELTKPGDRG
jgi:LCP family protein required for cell wall assembly